MKPEEIKKFQQKWKAIRSVEQKELSGLSVKEKFDRLGNLFHLAQGLGVDLDDHRVVLIPRSNWVRLKRKLS